MTLKISPEAWTTEGTCELTNKKCMVHTIIVSGEEIKVNESFYREWVKLKMVLKAKKEGN